MKRIPMRGAAASCLVLLVSRTASNIGAQAQPLSDPEWGVSSNPAYLLVPFTFTTAWSRNKY